MLLDEGYLGLECEHDLGQDRFSPVGSGLGGLDQVGPGCVWLMLNDAGEDPRGALLVHQAARAVDGVHDDRPAGVGGGGAMRQHDTAAGQSLGDQHQSAMLARDGAIDRFNQHVFGHFVDRVNRVALVVGMHVRQGLHDRAFRRRHHRVANVAMQCLERREQRVVGQEGHRAVVPSCRRDCAR